VSELGARLAFLNACLNGASALCLAAGYVAIMRGARRIHARLMVTAFVISTLFLVSYLARVFISGTHRFPGHGGWRTIYFTILFSHMALAVATPPLVVRAIWLAVTGNFDAHRRLVRYALPIWLYVSVTGVLVYLLLYHPPR
jgi:putative membrane protein